MQRTTMALTILALAGGAASTLSAQGRDPGLVEVAPPAMRSGMYITGGLGDGMDRYQYQDLSSYTDWLSSPAAVLRIGGTPNNSVRLGGELFGWWNSAYDPTLQENTTETFTAALLDVQFYPAARSGFYVKGGIGRGRSGTSFEFEQSIGKNAFVWSVGAGYDIPLSRSISIAPTIDFYQGAFNSRGVPTDSYTEQVLNIGASLTFQSGRRRR
jgi:opacity protein-like surface antigen